MRLFRSGPQHQRPQGYQIISNPLENDPTQLLSNCPLRFGVMFLDPERVGGTVRWGPAMRGTELQLRDLVYETRRGSFIPCMAWFGMVKHHHGAPDFHHI